MRTILLTGFGPFPGAPFNPTGPLVQALARRRPAAFAGVRRAAHVFRTSYDTVDRELPELLARVRPDALLMFGLAIRSRRLRIETQARNRITQLTPDADGQVPRFAAITDGGPETLSLRAPAQRLAVAARAAGLPAAVSDDAGSYLCNYLCWRASEAASRSGGPRVVTFVHVPPVGRVQLSAWRPNPASLTLDNLIDTGEALVLAALVALRAAH